MNICGIKIERETIWREVEATKEKAEGDGEDRRRGREIRYNEMAFIYEKSVIETTLYMLTLAKKDSVVIISPC